MRQPLRRLSPLLMFALVHRTMKRVRGSPSKGAVLINEDDLNEDKENYVQARWHAHALHKAFVETRREQGRACC